MEFSAAQLQGFAATLTEAFQAVVGRPPSAWERQALMAQSWLESGFGLGWKGSCSESHNWGAVQSRSPSCCRTTDHFPNGKPYQSYFVCSPTQAEGAKVFVREVARRGGTLAAAQAGNLGEYARILHATSYYGGLCGSWPVGSPQCVAKVVRDYAGGMRWRADRIAHALGETPIPTGTLPDEPGTLSGGSSASGLAMWAVLGAGAVGILAATLAPRLRKR